MAGGGPYANKPRPVVVVQDDEFEELDSVTLCPFTTNVQDVQIYRLSVEPTPANGLREPSQLMADKLETLPKRRLGSQIGRLADSELDRLNRSIIVFLGLAR